MGSCGSAHHRTLLFVPVAPAAALASRITAAAAPATPRGGRQRGRLAHATARNLALQRMYRDVLLEVLPKLVGKVFLDAGKLVSDERAVIGKLYFMRCAVSVAKFAPARLSCCSPQLHWQSLH